MTSIWVLCLDTKGENNMKDKTTKSKVKIFISSRESSLDPDGKTIHYERYRYVRRATKELLEETNMAQVYVRELEEVAGTRAITSEYLRNLREQDICIFIIDNEDDKNEHASGVVAEYEEAKRLNKKMMFIFCDEFCKAKTQIAKEKMNTSGPTCPTANTFAEIPYIIYNSVINDIINIYRDYCHPVQQDADYNLEVSLQSSQVLLNNNSKGIKLDEYPILQNAMNALLGAKEPEPVGAPFDILCADIFSFTTFKCDYDEDKLKTLEEEIFKLHDEAYHDVLKDKVSALKCYSSGETEKCYGLLRNAHSKAKDIDSFPNWMLLDILIDLRNIESFIANENNEFLVESPWQNEILTNSETVYYPILDRYAGDHFKSIDKFLREHETENPYTTRLGNHVNSLFENCFAAFAVAVSNVSITQILGIRERLIAAFSAMCRVYNAPSQFSELISLLIIEGKDKDLKKHIDALGYTQNISTFNALDASSILAEVFRIPFKKHRAYATILLFHYLGYYFSDDDYALVFGRISEIISDLLKNERYTLNLVDALTKAIKENNRRINADDIIEYIIHFTSFSTPYVKEATNLLASPCFGSIGAENKKKLVDAYIESSKRENNQEINNILHGLMILRKLYPEHAVIIDAAVLERNERYYYSDYAFELDLPNQNGESINHIDRFVKEASLRNESQGKNGIYSAYAYDPLDVLSNIIESSDGTISEEQVSEIAGIAKETLITGTQTISAKIHAVQLMLRLCNYCNYEPTGKIRESLINNQESIFSACEYEFFIKDTQELLAFNLSLLNIRLGENSSYNFISGISQSNLSYYNRIKMAKVINIYCGKNDWSSTGVETLLSIFHFSLAGCEHENSEVRVLSCRTLFELLRSDYKKIVSERLSAIMDNADWLLAQDIVYHISQADEIDKGLKDFVLQKAQSSNHFVVRKMARMYLNET